jgi:putative ABC transport system permease protein
MLRFPGALLNPWTWRMALRDSRSSRRRLLFFSMSIVLGVAALVAVGSLAGQMEAAIETQAKTLLGADLVISSRDALSSEDETFIHSLGGEQAREVSFSSMVYFLKNGGTRLIQVRAVEEGFPFYGVLETDPSSAAAEFQPRSSALVEDSLMNQFRAAAGDSVKIGNLSLPIAGTLRRAPGETVMFSTIAPRIYIPYTDLPKTGLVGESSLVRYKVYLKFPSDVNVEQLVRKLRPEFEKHGLGFDTVEERKKDLGRAVENAHNFLSLVGFIALLLGGVGIASAIHVHIKEKLNTVAILRCLGSSSNQAFAIYLAQAIALGLTGSSIGALAGLVVQAWLPNVIADFMPVQLSFAISWGALLQGIGLGVAICLLFGLLPLMSIRRVSPLAALRSSYENERNIRPDPMTWFCYALIATGVLAFGILQSRRWIHGLSFGLGICLSFAILAAVAHGVVRLVRGRIPQAWPYVWRQGMANLYRPNNRTTLLMLSLGLGTFLILTLYLVQSTVVRQLFPAEHAAQGNAVLFDVQPDQRGEVVRVMNSMSLPLLHDAPVVTMRIQSVKGAAVDQLRRGRRQRGGWALTREYRSTYRSDPVETEKVIAGEWHRKFQNVDSPVPISLEDGIAKSLDVTLGDEIIFDVQGIPITTRVASLREVDWRRLHPNFFVVFPLGALEEAPSSHILVTRVKSSEQSAAMQREVVRRFPNVSTIDLTLILHTVDAVVGKISAAIQFMALFTVGTGLLVLAGSTLTGRYQRIQESVLLRTLGASRFQIQQIVAVEYLVLGVLASLTGVVLALAASWALAHFIFKIKFAFALWPIIGAVVAVSGLTLLIGWVMNRSICAHPPLEVLRSET